MDDELYEKLIVQKEYVIQTLDVDIVTGDINVSTLVIKKIGIATYNSMEILNIIFLNPKCTLEYIQAVFLKNMILQLEAPQKTIAEYRIVNCINSLDVSTLNNEIITLKTLGLIAIKDGLLELTSNSTELVANYRLKMGL